MDRRMWQDQLIMASKVFVRHTKDFMSRNGYIVDVESPVSTPSSGLPERPLKFLPGDEQDSLGSEVCSSMDVFSSSNSERSPGKFESITVNVV